MKVFADFHHSGLGYALHLLFEKRLGMELYFPIGRDWFSNGYWSIAEPYGNADDTINQYLQLDHRYIPKDGTVPLNDIVSSKSTHYEIEDHAHKYIRKAITFEQFEKTNVDFIIASIPRHWKTYKRLRNNVKPSAKVICQMGNMFHEVGGMMIDGTIDNLMSSTIEFSTPSSVNTVFYHQEVDTTVFNYQKPEYDVLLVDSDPLKYLTKVTSFVNLHPGKVLFDELHNELPWYDMKAYGASCPNGSIDTIQEMSKIMKSSHWGFQVKPGGDGFGHVIYDWAFTGRPIITNFSDYKDKLAQELLEDRVTAINTQYRDVLEIAKLLEELSEPQEHMKLCKNMNERVSSCISYDSEQSHIEAFLDKII